MENQRAAFEDPKRRTQGRTRRQQQKPAGAAEAGGNYGDTVIASQRDQSQKHYQGAPSSEKEPAIPGVQKRRGRTEHYNDKTASENQGR